MAAVERPGTTLLLFLLLLLCLCRHSLLLFGEICDALWHKLLEARHLEGTRALELDQGGRKDSSLCQVLLLGARVCMQGTRVTPELWILLYQAKRHFFCFADGVVRRYSFH